MIDLGLPSGTKWACCNVGASKPEDYGGYYAWGETSTKTFYDWSTYIHCDGSEETCKDIGKDIAGTQYDAVTANWGSLWVMPNSEQMDELILGCFRRWTTENGVIGYRFIGPNGASIFLPAAGYRYEGELYTVLPWNEEEIYGIYSSSTLYELSYLDYSWGAYGLEFSRGHMWTTPTERDYGYPLRPVRRN